MKFYKKIKYIFTKSEFKKIIIIFFGIVIMGLIEIVGVSSIVPFMTVVSTPSMIHENSYLSFVYTFFNISSDNNFILLLGVFVIVVLLLSNIFQALMTWNITNFAHMQKHRLSVKLLQKYLEKPYSFHLTHNSSELGKNVITEVSRAVNGVILQLILALSKLIVIFFLFSLLLFIDSIIALTVTAVLIGAYWLIFRLVKHRLIDIGKETSKANFQVYKATSEALAGIKDIKLHNTERKFISDFCTPSRLLARYNAKNVLIASLPRYFLEVVAFGGIVTIAIFVIFTQTTDDSNSNVIATISLYAMIGYRLMPALQQVYTSITSIKFNMPAFKIMFDNIAEPKSEVASVTNNSPLEFKNMLKIKDLNFAYQESDKLVLKNINLDISHNTTVGFVGTTGSGKTTLIDILLGLLNPTSGSIHIDGFQLNKQNLSAWKNNIGYIPQVIYLMDGTIEDNIAFGVPDDKIDISKVKKAASIASLNEFVATLPNQYKTFIGERGVRLSGGQRQRIGIARALYNLPNILIMDEATSALDGKTERAIMDSIYSLSHERTILIIAHRLTTLKECDVVYMMCDGTIAASGTYQQLMEGNEEFRRLGSVDNL